MKKKKERVIMLTHIFCQVCNRTAELPHKCPDGTEWVKVSKRGVGI